MALAIFTLLAQQAFAQPAPFDMSPEKPADAADMPDLVLPPGTPGDAQQVPRPPVAAKAYRRFVIPDKDLVLSGEYDRRSWSVYLTEGEAQVPATLSFSYQNAVVVAPEASHLNVVVNGRVLSEEPIASSDGQRDMSLKIPAGLLQAGANVLEFGVSQRHRTDCDVDSTYELWTRIDPKRTFLEFAGDPVKPTAIGDAVSAIGVDDTGKTTFDFLMPALGQSGAAPAIMRLAQGLSLLSGMPNQNYVFSATEMPKLGPGRLGVVIGTAAELRPMFPNLPQTADVTPVALLQPAAQGTGTELVVTGPTWPSIMTVIDTMVASTDRPNDVRRDSISTQRWSAPDAPLLFGGEQIPLARLGVRTLEFNGRRLRTGFKIAVPSDFYANSYGEAVLLLDAAFTAEVEPGSHIDVYVNDNIATTQPITSAYGSIFRHLPVKIPLRHIRPGVNTISLQVVLQTQADRVCTPGSNGTGKRRFALFDTSELKMPVFARIGHVPDLSALAGTGYPYSRRSEALILSLDRYDGDTIGAAATLLARLALVAGQIIEVDTATSPTAIGERNALFVGALSQMPPNMLGQLKVSPASASDWRPDAPLDREAADTPGTVEEWRSQVRGSAFRDQLGLAQDWVSRNFDISLDSLHLLPQADPEFKPRRDQSLLLAQGDSPGGTAVWTAAIAPTSLDLRDGTAALTGQENWQKIAGRLTTFSTKTGQMTSVESNSPSFRQTAGPSLGNYRLIAANWLSNNILAYALIFIGLSFLLGVVTFSMLSRLGRRQ
nr:cellulose biosynthesis cyclic di-GMP-binding regulatory protein BcsB [Rhizobium halophytocola]